MQAIFGQGERQLAGQFDRAGKVGPVAEFRASHAQGDGQVGFADAGRAEEDDVAAFAQIPAGGQFVDQLGVERGLGLKIKVGQTLYRREARKLEVQGDRALVAFGEFAVEEVAEEVAVAPLPGGCALRGLVESVAGNRQTEAGQPAGGLGLEDVGAHPATSA